MAREFNQNQYMAEADVVTLFCKVTFNGASSPTLSSSVSLGANGRTLLDSQGIKSITRTDTGKYTVTFGVPSGATQNFQRLLGFSGTIVKATAAAVPILQVTADSASSGSVSIMALSAASTAADVTANDIGLLVFHLKNGAV